MESPWLKLELLGRICHKWWPVLGLGTSRTTGQAVDTWLPMAIPGHPGSTTLVYAQLHCALGVTSKLALAGSSWNQGHPGCAGWFAPWLSMAVPGHPGSTMLCLGSYKQVGPPWFFLKPGLSRACQLVCSLVVHGSPWTSRINYACPGSTTLCLGSYKPVSSPWFFLEPGPARWLASGCLW